MMKKLYSITSPLLKKGGAHTSKVKKVLYNSGQCMLLTEFFQPLEKIYHLFNDLVFTNLGVQ